MVKSNPKTSLVSCVHFLQREIPFRFSEYELPHIILNAHILMPTLFQTMEKRRILHLYYPEGGSVRIVRAWLCGMLLCCTSTV